MGAQQATQTEPAGSTTIDSDGLPAGERLSLEEMSRIMDVAATLRKERAVVDQQLNIDQIQAALRQRLMEAAKVSGDPVTEAEITAAVEQYYDRLHEFKEPPASFTKFLAHVWVLRGRLFKWLIGVVGAMALIFGLLAVRDAQQASVRSGLYEQSVATERAILAWDEGALLKPELDAKVAAAREALAQGDVATLERVRSELAALQGEFASQYEVNIQSGPNELSGRERVFTDDSGSRTAGYFMIVKSQDADGNPVPVKIHNREADRIETVTQWGEQVPEPVFERLEADKRADGVLDEREFAVKRQGTRELEIVLKGEDGQPITRGGQITSW